MVKECPHCGGTGEIRVPQGRKAAEKNLTHPKLYERDDAVWELLGLDDPASIPAVEAAIAVEESREMKADMQQLLDQLRATEEESE